MSHQTLNTEAMALISYLDAQRQHVLDILEGVSDRDLRRPVLPSGWTCLGMVQHLAFDVERFWFRAVVAGEEIAPNSTPDEAWLVAESVPAGVVFDAYRRECALANVIIAATPLDAPPAWWPPDVFGEWRLDTVREVILHVLSETACHTGHLDVVRELIDGRQWMVLT